MNTMNMPGFTAETSLYKTVNRYVQSAYGVALSDGSPTVIPQGDCPWWKFGGCIFAVGACTAGCVATGPGFAVCLGLCLGAAGAIGCIACAGLSAADEAAARQAANGVGGGGGGGGGCCPPGRRCCGSCASGQCDDICIGPGQSCP